MRVFDLFSIFFLTGIFWLCHEKIMRTQKQTNDPLKNRASLRAVVLCDVYARFICGGNVFCNLHAVNNVTRLFCHGFPLQVTGCRIVVNCVFHPISPTGRKNCSRAVSARGTCRHISTKESFSIFTSSSPNQRDRLIIDRTLSSISICRAHAVTSWPHIVASHYGVTCVASGAGA